jgi:hypothetical protein
VVEVPPKVSATAVVLVPVVNGVLAVVSAGLGPQRVHVPNAPVALLVKNVMGVLVLAPDHAVLALVVLPVNTTKTVVPLPLTTLVVLAQSVPVALLARNA